MGHDQLGVLRISLSCIGQNHNPIFVHPVRMATCAAIPARVPSLSKGMEALEEKRAVHKASKKSMDALLDLEYWDQECAVRTIDFEEAESSHACMMKGDVIKNRSADDLDKAKMDIANRKA